MTSAWAFAVAAWGRPGVEAICLELQDVHGQCPALLLWRLWTLNVSRAVDVDILDKALDAARYWEGEVLYPLRAVRRRLATPSPLLADARREAVRRRVQEAELEAEHALLDVLEALDVSAGDGGQASPLEALHDLAEAWRPPAPSGLLTRLVDAL